MHTGLVFNIQRYSIHDGPGIRTTVFLKGCPLHCWWCHNPESQAFVAEISIAEERCLHCGECREVCPQQSCVPHPQATGPLIDRERCVACGACVSACSAGARTLVGRRMSRDDVMQEVLKDRIFYDESGGGVTFSGGEPLTQAEFVRGLLEAARHAGMHTTLDTCGYARREHLLSVVPATDLFLYDLKIMDDERHRQYTGVSNALILDNLRLLGREHGHIWIRLPIIPGFNDDAKHVREAAEFAAAIHGVKQIHLLPYHETGSYKSGRLGRTNPLGSVKPPSAEQMQALADGIRNLGVPIHIGG